MRISDWSSDVCSSDLRTKGPTMALLARETDAGLEYAGSAMLTLVESERESFWQRSEAIGRDGPAIDVPNKAAALWFVPELRVRVQTLTGDKTLLQNRKSVW